MRVPFTVSGLAGDDGTAAMKATAACNSTAPITPWLRASAPALQLSALLSVQPSEFTENRLY